MRASYRIWSANVEPSYLRDRRTILNLKISILSPDEPFQSREEESRHHEIYAAPFDVEIELDDCSDPLQVLASKIHDMCYNCEKGRPLMNPVAA